MALFCRRSTRSLLRFQNACTPKPLCQQGRFVWKGKHPITGKFVSTKNYLEIIGTATKQTCPSVFLFTESCRYLFNCGENTFRLLHELKRLKTRISKVFLTGMTWQNHIGGLPSLLRYHSTLQDKGISVFGPQGVTKFMDDTGIFSGSIFRLKNSDALQSKQFDGNSEAYMDDNITIQPVVFETKDESVCNSRRQSICYICEFESIPGNFLLDKATEMEIPRELFDNLIHGQTVQLATGIQVYPHEVVTPAKVGQIFMIIECPSAEIRDMLIQSTEFSSYQHSGDLRPPHVIIHMTPVELLESSSYLSWMEQFGGSTKHILLSNNTETEWNPFLRSMEFQSKLSAIDPQVFSYLFKDDKLVDRVKLSENCIQAENLLGYQFRPLINEGLTRQNARVVFNFKNTFTKSKERLATLDKRTLTGMESTRFTSNKDLELQGMSESKVTFLGTGSSMPCYFRSNSSILLHTSESTSMLLDCGEGTFNQLQYLYGKNTEDILASLACIFLSHSHADHHVGLVRVLVEHEKLGEKRQLKALTVVGPWRLLSWLTEYFKLLGRSIPLRFLPFGEVKNGLVDEQMKEILNVLGITKFCVVPVLHCRDSHGLVLCHNSGWKLVYSGDCRPSPNLVREGKDATLLIHEATYFEISGELPLRAKHTTLPEALKVSREMNASFTILTHFSKHNKTYYPHEIAALRLGPRVSTAFDYMTVRFSDLPRLHRLRPAISRVLEGKRRIVSNNVSSRKTDIPAVNRSTEPNLTEKESSWNAAWNLEALE